jgi:hypothetical protein
MPEHNHAATAGAASLETGMRLGRLLSRISRGHAVALQLDLSPEAASTVERALASD